MMRGYGGLLETISGGAVQTISTQDRLERRKAQLEKELKAVNDAIALFSLHPEIADAMDLLGQIQM